MVALEILFDADCCAADGPDCDDWADCCDVAANGGEVRVDGIFTA